MSVATRPLSWSSRMGMLTALGIWREGRKGFGWLSGWMLADWAGCGTYGAAAGWERVIYLRGGSAKRSDGMISHVETADAERRVAEKALAAGARAAARDGLSSEPAGESAKYRRAVLGSSLAAWFSGRAGVGSAPMPVPEISAAARAPFVRLMDEILAARAADPGADTERMEWDIDKMVYDLYGLTEDEATAVERRLGLIHASDEDEDAALVRAMDGADGGDWVSKGEARRLLGVGSGD